MLHREEFKTVMDTIRAKQPGEITDSETLPFWFDHFVGYCRENMVKMSVCLGMDVLLYGIVAMCIPGKGEKMHQEMGYKPVICAVKDELKCLTYRYESYKGKDPNASFEEMRLNALGKSTVKIIDRLFESLVASLEGKLDKDFAQLREEKRVAMSELEEVWTVIRPTGRMSLQWDGSPTKQNGRTGRQEQKRKMGSAMSTRSSSNKKYRAESDLDDKERNESDDEKDDEKSLGAF